MDTPHEYEYLEAVAIVLQDLECFINQKINQSLIYALLQIKKSARKASNAHPSSIDRKSNASQSHKNYSLRKSSLSVQSSAKSAGKQSQASFDIIKGAEIFSETRKKAINPKIFTETCPAQQQYFQHQKEQPSPLSHHSQRYSGPTPKNNTIVPKLVGLVSQEEISDIEQPFGIESRNHDRKNIRHYEQSIQQVDDDDDQFEDIVLNRLDVIEQKVNEMLREKKNQRLNALNSRVRLSQPNHLSRSKLQNVGSGPNIIYSKNIKTDLYQYPESRYPNSTTMISPKFYTFHNSKNTSLQPSSKKMTNRSLKQNLTDRITNISKPINPQNYFTDNQQYVENGNFRNGEEIQYEVFEQVEDNQEFLTKNKKLGHYRQSSKTLNQPYQTENMPSSPRKFQKPIETTVNYEKIRQQGLNDKAFKYIPLNKINPNQTPVIEKTERQVVHNIENHNQPIPKNNSHNYSNKFDTIVVEKGGQNYETLSQKNAHSHHQKSYQGEYHRKNARNQDKYRSGRDSGIRPNHLNGSEVKAYTEHGDYVKNEDDLSVDSEKGIYSQIRELREITKLYGVERQKKYTQEQKPKSPLTHLQNISSGQYKGYDQRFHQKTQRPKYPQSRNYTQANEYDEEEQVIIREDYPKERVVRVIKQIPHYPPQTKMIQKDRIPEQRQYVEYETHEQVIYGQPYVKSSYHNPVYVVRQRQEPLYEQVQEIYEEPYYRSPNQSKFGTITVKEESKSKTSHRRMSSGSMHSFKSIPYVRTEGNPSASKEQSIEYVVQRPIRYVQNHAYSNY